MVQTAETAQHPKAVEVDVALRAEAPGTRVSLTRDAHVTETRTITSSTSPTKPEPNTRLQWAR